MKKFNSLFLMLVMAFSSVTLTACFDDDDDKKDCAEDLRAALEFATTKAQAMATNPSRATCDAYKKSLNDYKKLAEECGNSQHKQSADALINQANVTCDGL
ncbi:MULTISPECIES: hypothetical protein [Rufibacter]|uniref:Lipoprotein n=1 Tax=Rufibacter quisquiliarum TaxID=1549639 RepID=A0A839GWX4_9BACT|nr:MULTISPECIES: hypothetical protein [Rufibacter]MBA9079246.1 hypothetical protein [Rufibacter quisquiliarum]